ncbi:MAG: glycosyltransferase [Gemmatimonadaceae bacterium]|nr:glycosyltransferase [Gemmatimonadaceae bacterium]
MSERPLRILHVLNTVRETGNGIINTAMDLAWGQAQRGHHVAVASQGGEFESALATWGVAHHRIDQTRRVGTLWRAAWTLRALLRETAPDVVHAHMVTGTLLTSMVRGGRPPLLVAHVHNVYQRSARWMRGADVVLCCGTSVRATMQAQGVPHAKLQVVLNGTVGSPRLRNADDVAPAAIAKPAIVTVAGMNARKGIDELIAAFVRLADRHPDAHLHLVGDGPERPRFAALAAATPVASRIHFHGFQRDPMPFLRAADVFVLASRRESSPIVIGEARAAGCAIIATAVDGVPETLDDGRAGLLVPAQDAPALAEALHGLLSDPARRAALSAAAREGLDRFHVTRMVDETLALYRTFLT